MASDGFVSFELHRIWVVVPGVWLVLAWIPMVTWMQYGTSGKTKGDFVDTCFLDVYHEYQPLYFATAQAHASNAHFAQLIELHSVLIQHHKWGSRAIVPSVLSSLH